MKHLSIFLIAFLVLSNYANAQNSKGIHLQAIARNQNGMIIPNKQITLRLSIISDTATDTIEYQEIKSVTTNMLGLFFVELGTDEIGKVITIGDFEKIPWNTGDYFINVEVDPNNSLAFISAGIEKINFVPLAIYADKARTVLSIVPIELGGTGVASIKEISKLLTIDRINNTPDSLKPVSNATIVALNDKLKKADTISLSNRINAIPKVDTAILISKINQKLNWSDTNKISNRISTKLNSMDTLQMSIRINQKLNSSDTINLSSRINSIPKIDTTSLSNRINTKVSIGALNSHDIVSGLGYIPLKTEYGAFFDTSRQSTLVSTATAVKFYFLQSANKVIVTNNSAGNPTRITVTDAGVYQLNYNLQFVKSDTGTDELSIWIRRNSAAYANTNTYNIIQGAGIKNMYTGNYYIDLGSNDYVELYYSVKNINSVLTGIPPITTTPSRPATPSASISLHAVN
jgi:hypothetical protein